MSETAAAAPEVILGGRVPIKAWTRGVQFQKEARQQLRNVADLPFVYQHVAVMPDVHWGIGATVGSVIPTLGAVVPAAVGVDIGCGMMALRTTLAAGDLPENLAPLRSAIEEAVPHGRTSPVARADKGSWRGEPPRRVREAWEALRDRYERIVAKHPAIGRSNSFVHLGTLGTGNHFVEICLDESDRVWIVLHSGSRGVGNKIGTYFIRLAKEDMRRSSTRLPDSNLAFFAEGTEHFGDYMEAVEWAQDFARANRHLMMEAILEVLGEAFALGAPDTVVNCHHNYVARENHYGRNVLLTRKGAVRARAGDLGIIPGSMGARSYIVRGKGNAESFHSCSHGAGRLMSRTEAKRRFTLADHRAATSGVECRKDAAVLDETPGAYKPIDAVMEAQRDLVEIVHTLQQVVCVKG